MHEVSPMTEPIVFMSRRHVKPGRTAEDRG